MTSLYALKPRFQALLRPAVRTLNGLGASANQVTLGTCAASLIVGSGLTLAADAGQLRWLLLLPLCFLLRMALNAIDGMLAREFDQISTLGTYLNELSDVVSDAALYLPFAFIPEAGVALTLLLIFLANLAEIAGVLGVVTAGNRRNDGPMGKSDRALVFGLLGLLLGAGVAPGAWLSAVMALIALLLLLTIANRVRRGIAEANANAGH
ncbi:MAG: CDP-alcohol phosphatidyltransferase family protein [Candidatus Accumulibacter sp.]|uniref:CDP-alcohol phosphatidyltransferase family protein n=1 Tax=Candidatus Accumulibacter affinis TaxID=2954384 RepID=A0A935W3B1_9PROT|nr:CDP-alcohol phosphatidyltransferase family protein [Candidatus Accumulibacter affinis]